MGFRVHLRPADMLAEVQDGPVDESIDESIDEPVDAVPAKELNKITLFDLAGT